MKIRFYEEVELEVVENYDEINEVADTYQETFKKGEEIECDLLGGSGNGDCIDVQFGDGSCAFGIPKNLVQVLRE